MTKEHDAVPSEDTRTYLCVCWECGGNIVLPGFDGPETFQGFCINMAPVSKTEASILLKTHFTERHRDASVPNMAVIDPHAKAGFEMIPVGTPDDPFGIDRSVPVKAVYEIRAGQKNGEKPRLGGPLSQWETTPPPQYKPPADQGTMLYRARGKV